jgi:hypothetical protein
LKRLSCLAPLLLLGVSCSSTTKVEFYVNAVNTEEQEIPAVLFVDDSIFLDPATNQPVKTPARVKIPFEAMDQEGGWKRVKLSARGVAVDAQGKITFGLREGEASPYVEEPRFVDTTDAKVQLFILRRNKDYRPPGE